MQRDLPTSTEKRRPAPPFARSVLLIALALLLPLTSASAQALPGQEDAAKEEQLAQDSPRAALGQFLDLCRANRYADAARFLDVPTAERARAPQLAERLKAVLDRHVWIDLSSVSPLSGGNAEDELPAGVDELARIPSPSGKPEPVRLVRSHLGEAGWVFSRATVGRIDSWYEHLEHRWLLEHLPPALLRVGPYEILYWQWLVLPFLLILARLIGGLLARASRHVLARIAGRTTTRWDDEMLARIGGPLGVAWTLATAYVLLSLLGLYQPAEDLTHRWLRGGLFVVFFWMLARMVDVARQVIAASSWAQSHTASRSLLPLGARVGKVVVLAIAVVALLSELGYPVASLVAGLGIGGLAVALAAQRTVENLFGAFSLGADQPFREGDFVRIEDFVGTVEAIGLRSTRIRTLDRTLISIPNGKLADMRLESFSERDRIRLACKLGLVYETDEAQMREILTELEKALRAHPKIWPDAVVVRFMEFGDSSLNIEVMAWFQTSDWGEFQLIRQELLLQFMRIVGKAGSSFAFPTRTLHLVPQKAA